MSTFKPDTTVKTRDGRDAHIIATDVELRNGDAIVSIIDGLIHSHRPDGRYFNDGSSNTDLMPPKTSRFQNIYHNGNPGLVHTLRVDADDSAEPDRFAVLEYIFSGDELVDIKVHRQ